VASQRTLRWLACALGVVALAAGWRALAPTGLGGTKLYYVVRGQSMEPSLHAGDLVVLEGDADYQVGEVAVYDSTSLDRAILHRIVARRRDRLIFKGDHNPWADRERPDPDRLRGKLWMHFAGAGRWASSLTEPAPIGVGAGAVTLLIGASVGPGRRRSRWKPRSFFA
jgi:signal peptidase